MRTDLSRTLCPLALVVAWASSSLCANATDAAGLYEFFSTTLPTDVGKAQLDERLPEVMMAVVELQAKALPILLQVLASPDEDARRLAMQCLAYIPGPEAARVLRQRYAETKDLVTKTALCSALAGSGAPDDVSFLIQSLKGEPYGEEGAPMAAAAYSLGILKERTAEAALKVAAEDCEGFLSGQAASCALNWIQGPGWRTPQRASATGADAVILAAIRFGIPRMDESEVFFESTTKRLWARKGDSWSYETVTDPKRAGPSVSFSVAFTRDGQRAICSVGFRFGPLNGSGFDFVLNKDGQEWRVVGFVQTWIS